MKLCLIVNSTLSAAQLFRWKGHRCISNKSLAASVAALMTFQFMADCSLRLAAETSAVSWTG